MAFLLDGFRTLISVAAVPGGNSNAGIAAAAQVISFLEHEVTPFGVDGGGGIDITNMRTGGTTNGFLRQKFPKSLATIDDIMMTVLWNPVNFSTIINSLLQQIAIYTVRLPDATSESFYGWMDKFKPKSHKEGDLPLADLTFIPSNCYINNLVLTSAPAVLNGVNLTMNLPYMGGVNLGASPVGGGIPGN